MLRSRQLPRRLCRVGCGVAFVLAACAGCIRVKTDPIHITMDVNVRIDRELDSFFKDVDAPAVAAQPAVPETPKGDKAP